MITETCADCPRLLADLRPAAGVLKSEYEDFEVEELPAYPASGAGTHTFFQIEKRGLATMQAVHDIAAALGVRRFEIGVAGLKDARAVTRQWMSVEHVAPERVAELEVPRIRVLQVTRHTNKLRIGHLRANRFRIRVRQTETQRLAELQDALAELVRRGVPNYFGAQRFGARGDTWRIGRAIVHENLEEALDHLLGRPGPSDFGDVRRARKLYEDGNYAEALRAWPRIYRDQRAALKALLRTRGKKKRGMLAVDERMRLFCVSAYQSMLFNRVVAERLPTGLEKLHAGDLAQIHANGAVFRVEDTAAEQPRSDRFEISATGPIYGYRMTEPHGEPAQIEARVLEHEQLNRDRFHTRHLRVKGTRRPLRFQPQDSAIRLGADARGPYLELGFTLASGCYATSLLRELFAEPLEQGEEADGEATES